MCLTASLFVQPGQDDRDAGIFQQQSARRIANSRRRGRKAAKLTNFTFRETIEVLDEVPEWTWGSQDA
jgi:hypothetical protein